MSNRSKTHHYVPKSLLKIFSVDKKEKQIFAYDKESKNVITSSIKNAGSEKYFYSIRTEGKEYNFENSFQNLDDALPKLLRKIITTESLSILSKHEKEELILLTAFQFARTKKYLDDIQQQHNYLYSIIKDIGFEADVYEGNAAHLSKEFNREQAKSLFVDRESLMIFTKSIKEKIVSLVINENSHFPFWISDNPVVMNNSNRHLPFGLSTKGTYIFYPISPKLLLFFRCRSDFYHGDDKSELIENSVLINSIIKNYVNFETVQKTPLEFVKHANSLQVENSSRFIYSNINNFSFIDKLSNFKQGPFKDKTGLYLYCYGEFAQYEILLTDYDMDTLLFCGQNGQEIVAASKEQIITNAWLFKNGMEIMEWKEIRIFTFHNFNHFGINFINPMIGNLVMQSDEH